MRASGPAASRPPSRPPARTRAARVPPTSVRRATPRARAACAPAPRARRRPGPVAIAAGTITATAASASSGTAAGRRSAVGSPSGDDRKQHHGADHREKRCPRIGYGLPFQMPPSPARLPSVPRPGSARAAKTDTPVACVEESEPASAEATSHGSAAEHRHPEAEHDAQPARPTRPRGRDTDHRDGGGQQQPRRRQSRERNPEHQRPRNRRRPHACAALPSPPTAGSRSPPAGSSGPATTVRPRTDSRSRA